MAAPIRRSRTPSYLLVGPDDTELDALASSLGGEVVAQDQPNARVFRGARCSFVVLPNATNPGQATRGLSSLSGTTTPGLIRGLSACVVVWPADRLILETPVGRDTTKIQQARERLYAQTRALMDSLSAVAAMLPGPLPLYVLITRIDQLPGMSEFVDRLEPEQRRQIVGWSRRQDDPLVLVDDIIAGYDEIAVRLKANVMASLGDGLQDEQALLDRLIMLPAGFQTVRQGFVELAQSLVQQSATTPAVNVRGVYVASLAIEQATSPLVARAVTGLADFTQATPIATAGERLWLDDLLEDKLLPDYASLTSRHPKSGGQRGALVTLGLLCLVLSGAAAWTWAAVPSLAGRTRDVAQRAADFLTQSQKPIPPGLLDELGSAQLQVARAGVLGPVISLGVPPQDVVDQLAKLEARIFGERVWPALVSDMGRALRAPVTREAASAYADVLSVYLDLLAMRTGAGKPPEADAVDRMRAGLQRLAVADEPGRALTDQIRAAYQHFLDQGGNPADALGSTMDAEALASGGIDRLAAGQPIAAGGVPASDVRRAAEALLARHAAVLDRLSALGGAADRAAATRDVIEQIGQATPAPGSWLYEYDQLLAAIAGRGQGDLAGNGGPTLIEQLAEQWSAAGAPAAVVSNAFERARQRGREGTEATPGSELAGVIRERDGRLELEPAAAVIRQELAALRDRLQHTPEPSAQALVVPDDLGGWAEWLGGPEQATEPTPIPALQDLPAAAQAAWSVNQIQRLATAATAPGNAFDGRARALAAAIVGNNSDWGLASLVPGYVNDAATLRTNGPAKALLEPGPVLAHAAAVMKQAAASGSGQVLLGELADQRGRYLATLFDAWASWLVVGEPIAIDSLAAYRATLAVGGEADRVVTRWQQFVNILAELSKLDAGTRQAVRDAARTNLLSTLPPGARGQVEALLSADAAALARSARAVQIALEQARPQADQLASALGSRNGSAPAVAIEHYTRWGRAVDQTAAAAVPRLQALGGLDAGFAATLDVALDQALADALLAAGAKPDVFPFAVGDLANLRERVGGMISQPFSAEVAALPVPQFARVLAAAEAFVRQTAQIAAPPGAGGGRTGVLEALRVWQSWLAEPALALEVSYELGPNPNNLANAFTTVVVAGPFAGLPRGELEFPARPPRRSVTLSPTLASSTDRLTVALTQPLGRFSAVGTAELLRLRATGGSAAQVAPYLVPLWVAVAGEEQTGGRRAAGGRAYRIDLRGDVAGFSKEALRGLPTQVALRFELTSPRVLPGVVGWPIVTNATE